MLNMKKALAIGAALTAICATAAFAAESQENKENKAPENYGPGACLEAHRGPHGDHFRHHGPMTQEEREAMQQRRETWKNMTPEQREEAYQKYIQERIEKASTPEEKERLQKMEERRQEWLKMTPEQRKEACEKMKKAHEEQRQERLNKLTPEQRQEVEKFIKDDQAQRKAMGERLEKMTPEQRDCIRDARMAEGPRHRGPHGEFRGHGPQEGGPRGDFGGPRHMPPPPPENK